MIVYANGKENVSLNVEARVISNEYFRGGFMNKIVALKASGKDIFAIPREIQLNPVTDKIEHADFLAVDDKSVVKVWVPIHMVGTEKSVGLKRGGVLNIVLHDLDVVCAPDAIPDDVVVDVTGLDVGASIHIHDIKLPAGVTAAHADRDDTVATIVAPSGLRSEEGDTTKG